MSKNFCWISDHLNTTHNVYNYQQNDEKGQNNFEVQLTLITFFFKVKSDIY